MIEHINIPEERIRKMKQNNKWVNDVENFLEVVINLDEDVSIEGNSLQVLRAKEIIMAFARGFSFNDSLGLLDEEYFLEIAYVKDFTGKSRDRQTIMKGRLIGEGGTTKKLIEKYADVKVAIHGKTISIIGKPQNIKIARTAIEMILSGSKHNTVYRFLRIKKWSNGRKDCYSRRISASA